MTFDSPRPWRLLLGAAVVITAVMAPGQVVSSAQAAVLPQAAQTQIITLAPTDDAATVESLPAVNRGSDTQLYSRGDPAQESFLKFALPSAPSGTALSAATFRAYTSSDPSAGSGSTHDIDLVSGSWSEGSVTWNSRPTSVVSGLGTISDATTTVSAISTSLNVTALANQLGGSATLRLSSDGTDNLRLFSKEYATTEYRPYLVLTFVPQATTTTTVKKTVLASADAYVRSASPATNYGDYNQIASLSAASNVQQAFLRFDVPSAPSGTALTAATLRVFTSSDPTAGSVSSHDVTIMSGSWTESDITWNNRPTTTGATACTISGATATSASYQFDCSASALSGVVGTSVTLRIATSGSDNLRLMSKEFGSNDLTPALLLTYSPTATAKPVAVFIGDSYTQGVGGGGTKWTSIVAGSMGWTEVNLGRGGTGYKVTAGVSGCGLSYCPNYLEMVPDAIAAGPDIVIVAGGRNDAAVYADQVKAVYAKLRAGLPNAKIYGMNPLMDDSAVPSWFAPESSTVKAAVEAVGGTYLDIGQPLVGHPELVASDSIHPNAAGYRVIAQAVLAELN